MRIAFVGNQDNNAYRICNWVRETEPHVHLYLINDDQSPRSLPEYVDKHLAPDADGYPDWIHHYDDRDKAWFLRGSRLARQIEQEYDVVVTSGTRGLLAAAQFRRRMPIVHLTLGSEVSDFPYRLPWVLAHPIWWLPAVIMRRALRRIARIVTLGFWPELESLGRLGLLPKAMIWGFPEDPESNRTRVHADLLAELNTQYAEYDRVFMWFARLNLDPTKIEYKAPERFVEAFDRIVKEGRKVRAIIGTHGAHVDEFQAMVTRKGLDEHVDYVPHIPMWQLLTYASLENGVIMDTPELEHGHVVGGLVREAMSVGAVVIAAQDPELMRLCYGQESPILTACDAESCYRQMARCADMSPAEFKALRGEFGEWVREHLHYRRAVPHLIEAIRQAAYSYRLAHRRPAAEESADRAEGAR
jgi:glycosyltransferase involved in cell wall biosynthesis